MLLMHLSCQVTCIVHKMATLTESSELQNRMSFEQTDDFDVPSVILTFIMLGTLIGTILVAFLILLVQIAVERARLRRKAASELPECEWQLAEGQQYICFLSHVRAHTRPTNSRTCLCSHHVSIHPRPQM